ncbi:MAG: TraB/GumN family protein [Chitinophagaceae bacterium]|nr:TraB/GumN family protein [Chitinophagaceae bacterium]
MKRTLLFLLAISSFIALSAQPVIKAKKYPSLLWEITGNGMKKPSYLIGTMHVSSKLAFNLPDSFYIAVRSAQVVALETNPETWQEDMSKYDFGESGYSPYLSRYNESYGMPSDYLGINTLKFYKYDTKIERALYSNPSTINNLLYRTYGNEASDFEEDTYLDMYIFQCGKKWGKKVTGVENYGESMKLMEEAYQDAAKDKNQKRRSYGDMDEDYSSQKLQEAYRSGNLDLLDTINKYNSFSAAFDEKFLYRRNEIQANSIDSILKSGSSLFVGVGAAHLPGDRGVIEMLRSKGYKLRPVKMGERASKEKDIVDKLRVPVTFKTETAEDGLYKVDIPGKFYKYGDDFALEQRQYADMANGSYYMVTRIMTNAWMWNHNSEDVYKKIDSLLYENIPGKILSKTTITKNGYKGFDITNRTRRGDMQRYNIFITPFEIVFFKMSGNSDYVGGGDEAKKFFGSIQFKEYKNGNEPTAWKKYSPAYGGFAIDLPHDPYIGNDGSWLYDAVDKSTGTSYRVIRTDIHNYSFAEEDTFDLGLLDESFMASEFIDTQLYRKQTRHKGYPALDCKYRDKDGQVFVNRFIIQGPHYYTLVAHGKQEIPAMTGFLNSFELKPYVYGESKSRTDTSLYFTVKTPVYPEDKKIKLSMPSRFSMYDEEEEESETDILESGIYRNKTIFNDTTGEKIYIAFNKTPRYYYTDDSSFLVKARPVYFMGDSAWIVKKRVKTVTPGKTTIWETMLTDTGSSRVLWSKTYYKEGTRFSLFTQTDTLSAPSQFLKDFFESFVPADTLKSASPFVKKSALFFEDFLSKDSVVHKRAVKNISDIELDSADLPQLKHLIATINWSEKNYLDTKESLISKLGDINSNEVALYLKDLYYSLDDTVQLQYAVLENLLQQKTKFAYNIFKDIVSNEPPVLSFSSSNYSDYSLSELRRRVLTSSDYSDYDYDNDNGRFLDELSDSLQLTKTILPDLLPLLNLDDYKGAMMNLLSNLADSNLLKPQDYEMYYSKFLIEAKQELKKQAIAEKRKAIEKAEESKTDKKLVTPYGYLDDDDEKDEGNADLGLYARLLMPFWDTYPAVPALIKQMLASSDKRLKYSTMLLLMDKKKPYPDTLLKYFAGMDEYRYELYTDLKDKKMLSSFPATFNNHLDLGRSALLGSKSYGKPDSVVFVDRLPAKYKDKNGFIYFFKYKEKKDDLNWKLATVGLVPENPSEFEFEDTLKFRMRDLSASYLNYARYNFNRYSFTEFTDTKIKEDEPLDQLLRKELKKMLYSRRSSAREFYEEDARGGRRASLLSRYEE